MTSLARGQASDCDAPVLDLWTMVQGAVVDVEVLEFEVWDVTGAPTQVYPGGGGRQSVDVVNDCPVGHRLGLGHYVAEWTPDLAEALGSHEIRWFAQVNAGDPEIAFTETFEVVAQATATASRGYCTIQDLRDEGVPDAGTGSKTDAQLSTIIERNSRMIERFTGRWFYPKPLAMRLDGTGRRGLLLDPPIISISQIRLVSTDYFTPPSGEVVELANVRIYNRHLQGLLSPDDRESPKIELVEFDHRVESLPPLLDTFDLERWPEGTQNVEATGVFGYTEPDGSPTGKTPDLISRACVLMCLRDLETGTSDDRWDARNAFRVTKLKTRDQSIEWAAPGTLGGRGVGVLTGDPEIDTILASYRRPPSLGAV